MYDRVLNLLVEKFGEGVFDDEPEEETGKETKVPKVPNRPSQPMWDKIAKTLRMPFISKLSAAVKAQREKEMQAAKDRKDGKASGGSARMGAIERYKKALKYRGITGVQALMKKGQRLAQTKYDPQGKVY